MDRSENELRGHPIELFNRPCQKNETGAPWQHISTLILKICYFEMRRRWLRTQAATDLEAISSPQ